MSASEVLRPGQGLPTVEADKLVVEARHVAEMRRLVDVVLDESSSLTAMRGAALELTGLCAYLLRPSPSTMTDLEARR